MRIMIRGKGGRESAICAKLDGNDNYVICAPGNAGFLGSVPKIGVNDTVAAIAYAKADNIDLVICGPEAPLIAGEADAFAEAGILYCGPKRAAAMMTEGSKVAFKKFLERHGIPTAGFAVYRYNEMPFALMKDGFIGTRGIEHVVVKADGPCEGKGVILPDTANDYYAGIHALKVKYPSSTDQFVVEERLPGPEYSVMGVADAKRFLPFPTTRDAKRRGPEPGSPNTGGMGAFTCPMSPEHEAEALGIVQAILDGLWEEDIEYRGPIYVGFMVGADGHLYVLECNCRLGDPETQAALFAMDCDLAHLCKQAALGDLSLVPVPKKILEAVCVVITSPEYPEKTTINVPMYGFNLARAQGAFVFHASTVRDGNGALRTNGGGRIVSVVATDSTLAGARKKAYDAVRCITLEGVDISLCCRTDIALSK